jgi:histidyl-tRNA synthetase
MEIKTDKTVKGTRILFGEEVVNKDRMIRQIESRLNAKGFQKILLPIIQSQETFNGKVGKENQHMMYTFKDRGNRDLCLAPEYTAVIQDLAKTQFKYQKDIKVYYIQECFRGEKPQAGRYRQFTQFGVEIINPSGVMGYELDKFAFSILCDLFTWAGKRFKVNTDVTRGLDYYKQGKGFEITCDELGSSKQVCGGGEYDGGIGFAFGIDRLLLVDKNKEF